MAKELSEYWWCSFVDPKKPHGSQFIGVAIVGPAPNMMAAHLLTVLHGCNPGGEMAAFQIPKDHLSEVPLDKFARLLSREECSQIGDARPISEWKKMSHEAN